jgi:hypothetical protein
MGISTYSDLVAEFNLEIARTETSRIDGLIAQVEADLNNNKYFRISDMQVEDTLSTSAGISTVAMPADTLTADELFLDTSPSAIEFMPENLMAVRFDPSYVARPSFYCFLGTKNIKFAATPDAAYSFTFRYKQKIPNLSSGSPTNWLLTKNPNIYLHGCAYYFSVKIKDYDQMNVYKGLYSQAVQATIDADESITIPDTALAMYTVDR